MTENDTTWTFTRGTLQPPGVTPFLGARALAGVLLGKEPDLQVVTIRVIDPVEGVIEIHTPGFTLSSDTWEFLEDIMPPSVIVRYRSDT